MQRKQGHGSDRGKAGNELTAFLPTMRCEMEARGWDILDILIIMGDAYVDHPAFGPVLISRFLEARGYRVGIVPQPDWKSVKDIARMGRPRLFVGVSSGNLDSMLNKLTAQKKVRSKDQYSPGSRNQSRPNRATIVYSNLCRQAFPGLPIVLGGVEASLRRIAHYDYWSDKVRRSILFDAKADLLVFGMGEQAVTEVAQRLNAGQEISEITDVRGTAYIIHQKDKWMSILEDTSKRVTDGKVVVLPSYEQVRSDKREFALASRMFQNETNPGNARPLLQVHGSQALFLNPPAFPWEDRQMDELYDLPFQRRPHPQYKEIIPAYETVKHSIVSHRGCFGGCSFCSITEHEGRIIQSRSQAGILREVRTLSQLQGFRGVISDVGGPTANMYKMRCRSTSIERACRRLSCLHPSICKNLNADHTPFTDLLKRTRQAPGIKDVFIASGIRYDLAELNPEFIEELAVHHTGGMVSVAPEHNNVDVLTKMKKPSIQSYERFLSIFRNASEKIGKEQYLIPYFIVGHPGSTLEDTIDLALYLKRNGVRPRQIQEFIPTPMAMATTMYYTGIDPFSMKTIHVTKDLREKRMMKALLLYWDEKQWPLAREALKKKGRKDLIGRAEQCLVPPDYGPTKRKHFTKSKKDSAIVGTARSRTGGHRIRYQSDRIQRRRTPRVPKG